MKASGRVELSKLKIDKFTKIATVNFPADVDLRLRSSSSPEVLIHFIGDPADIAAFVASCRKAKLPQDNRVIMVFRKGNKALNRDTIIGPFRDGTYPGFKLTPPMLCALSDTLSAFVLRRG
jgi:hypothetical protein